MTIKFQFVFTIQNYQKYQNTIMHIAVINNDSKMIEILLEHEMDSILSCKNKEGKTPIALATEHGIDIIKLIANLKEAAFLLKLRETMKSSAIAIIDEEIQRLEPSNKQNNTLLGQTNSDFKIELWGQLKQIIENDKPNIMQELALWEAENKAESSYQRSKFFQPPLTKTEEAIQKIKNVFQFSEDQLSNALDQYLEIKEEKEGFLLV